MIASKNGRRVVIQCKKHAQPVGNKAVQEVTAARIYFDAHRAAVVSNASYTPAARALSEKTGVLLLHFTDLARADTLFNVR